MKDKRVLPPSAVVLDLVLLFSTRLGMQGTAVINEKDMAITTRNHRGEFVMLSVPVHFDGEPDDEAPRFVLTRLGAGVWKLRPSILHESIHAYVTVINVPEPAPFERGETGG
jgi:hypothetical protein